MMQLNRLKTPRLEDRPARVGVTNATLANTGDAAIHQAIRQALTAELGETVEFVVFDSSARTTKRLYPDWLVMQQVGQLARFRPMWAYRFVQYAWTLLLGGVSTSGLLTRGLVCLARGLGCASLPALARCDVVVSSGGTYFVDSYNFLHQAVELRLAKALGKRVVLWTQSVGPFETRTSRAHIRTLARVPDASFFRDRRSAEAWISVVGGSSSADVVPDAVFGIEIPEGLRVDVDRPPALNASDQVARRVAAISVRAWSRGVRASTFDAAGYRSMMREAVTTLAALGWRTQSLSTCQGVPAYGFDDSAVAGEIFSGLPIAIDRAFHTPDALMRRLADVDAVVTTRMHLAILGLVLGLPVVAVAYEFKTVELFESLGLGENAVLIEDSSPTWMHDVLVRLSHASDSFRIDDATRRRLRAEALLPARSVSRILGASRP